MSGIITAASRYADLQPTRAHYITRAERQARLTIPSLFVEQGFDKGSDLYTPYQSVGARGVNNLASKLLLSLFPPNSTFFKLSVDELTINKMMAEEGMKAKVDEGLATIERVILNRIETSPLRTSVFEALKQLLVAGNVCMFVPVPAETRVFKLNHYVVRRSPNGGVLEAVIEEDIAEAALPPAAKAALELGNVFKREPLPSDKKATADAAMTSKQVHKVYTHICLEGDMHKTYQEINGQHIPGTEASYPVDKSPWMFLRFTKIDGEDYGRAYVEEYYGDLFTLEELMKTVVDGAAIMSKIVFLVDPAGTTRSEDLSKAENGDFVEGHEKDISTLQAEKTYDLQWAKGVADDIIQRIAQAFLMNSSVQRNGERVTAEEIRYMARELEDVLGGVYSIQSQEFQLPFVRRLIFTLSKKGDIPTLPKEIQPMIVTGLAALGRGNDLDKLDALLRGAREALGEQVVARYMKVNEYLTRRATALSIDIKGLFRTDDEIAQEDQQNQMMALGPDAIKAGTQLATKSMEQPQQ